MHIGEGGYKNTVGEAGYEVRSEKVDMKYVRRSYI
jgi:hypothetical protein